MPSSMITQSGHAKWFLRRTFFPKQKTRALRWRQRKQRVQIHVRCVYFFVLFFWWTNIVGCEMNKIQRKNIIWDGETCARELHSSYTRLNCDYGSTEGGGEPVEIVTVAAYCCMSTASAGAEKAHKSRWQKCTNKQTVPVGADDGENELRTR